jgi:hypothetical protein
LLPAGSAIQTERLKNSVASHSGANTLNIFTRPAPGVASRQSHNKHRSGEQGNQQTINHNTPPFFELMSYSI